VDTLWTSLYDHAAIKFLNLQRNHTILDVGCGSGLWGWTLRRLSRSKPAKLVGLDKDRTALEQASKILGTNTDLVNADASFLPFRDDSFDLVTCRRLLINLRPRKRRQVIREMKRVASGGGTLSSAEPSLHISVANAFSTVSGSLYFSKRLERAFSGTDFKLGPKVPYLFVREGLGNVDVWAYLIINRALPPRYSRNPFMNPIVHGGGFSHSLKTMAHPLRGDLGKRARLAAKRLDRETAKQVRRKSLVSVFVVPMFVTKGTKP